MIETFEANRERVAAAWLALRDAVIHQYDTWAESSVETRRLRDVARQISGIPADYVNTVVCGNRGMVAEIVQPRRYPASANPADALICLQRGPYAPAWAAWINEARELIEIVEKSAGKTSAPLAPDLQDSLGHHGPKDRDRR